MKKKSTGKATAILFLLLCAPILGELVSGSSPPLEFFSPIRFVILVVLYGGGALLIREAKVRWGLGWSIIFLAIAYGVLEEGLMMQSFFNHHHADLNAMSRYGMYLKTQWPWSIQLTLYHATVSTLIPIFMTDLLWPKFKKTAFLTTRGIKFLSLILILETILMGALVIIEHGKVVDPYLPDPLVLIICALVTLLLILLASKLRHNHHIEKNTEIKSPFIFGLLAFILQLFNLLFPYIMADLAIPSGITIGVQLLVILLVLRFVFKQIYNRQVTIRHYVNLIFGYLSGMVILTPIMEYSNGVPHMFTVGIITFVLLITFRTVVLRRERKHPIFRR